MKYAYFYIKKEQYADCVKYGLKLSEFANKLITINNYTKKGILCYLTPKDSKLYNSENYKCAKIDISDIQNVFVVDDSFEKYSFYNEYIQKASDYTFGTFENPKVVICTSVIPEHIHAYNYLIDSPLPYENSREYYYLKNIYNLIEENKVNLNNALNYLLHEMVDENKAEYFSNKDESVQIFIDKEGKKYTVCN